ncbi:hypothetical protein H839_09273 [Parageobacillus genomosp. 1]|uniref:Uncharacterized protein n=1 Tax=Parageobacillus genomosp. 1 TaxID=1295642 RepID=A0ABC9VE93_9BACL|nr:hypothetical protein H839_09273 [Parageobacillus genomosp. 1]
MLSPCPTSMKWTVRNLVAALVPVIGTSKKEQAIIIEDSAFSSLIFFLSSLCVFLDTCSELIIQLFTRKQK